MNRRVLPVVLACLAVLAGLFSPGVHAAGDTMPLQELARHTHFHGIAAHPGDGQRVFLATHHGLFSVDREGLATRVSQDANDYMGFTPHPTERDVLFASGHPAGGGNMGFIVSEDAGRTWRQLSPGVNGPVDFHQMDVSRANPEVIYGTFGGLQVSRDGGRTWTLAAPAPQGLIDLAASAADPDRLYAATKSGLLLSTDAGATWQPAHLRRSPATLVQTGHSGEVYAFVLGVGLLRTQEPELRWENVSNGFGNHYVLHLAVDPADARHVYAVTNAPAVLESADGGVRWVPLGTPAPR